MTPGTLSTVRSPCGTRRVYRHASRATVTDMTFSAYVPPHAREAVLPVVAPSRVP